MEVLHIKLEIVLVATNMIIRLAVHNTNFLVFVWHTAVSGLIFLKKFIEKFGKSTNFLVFTT